MATVKEYQKALITCGYDLGPDGADGIAGRMTQAATRKFQRDNGLSETGIFDEALAHALKLPSLKLPPWFVEMGRRKGLHEVRANAALRAWLKSDGPTLGDPAKYPWCGDAMETAINLTLPDEPMVTNPYLARNWQKFGQALELDQIVPGAITVFWRTHRTKSTNGHIAQATGRYTKTEIEVRGGNQRDTISDTWLDRDRLLAIRWPLTYPLPSGGGQLLARRTGAVSTNEA